MRRLNEQRRSGFTLIELLVVVVIIGILAAISIPKFRATKNKANYAALKSDLKNLSTAEEGFFYDFRTYSTNLDSLRVKTSHGVVITIVEATSAGWSATAYHPDSWPHTCALYYGSVNPIAPATSEGAIYCN
jgi:type IV pilus assembly protein PilA